MSKDIIYRQDAIDAMKKLYDADLEAYGCEIPEMFDCDRAIEALKELPSAEPVLELDEWCMDCKEYDHDKHCCPRFNRVIRSALQDAELEPYKGEQE